MPPVLLLCLRSSSSTAVRQSSATRTRSLVRKHLPSGRRPLSSPSSPTRKLQTATAYRPYTLPLNPTPPRNAGVTETSIAGVPGIDDVQQSPLSGHERNSEATSQTTETTDNDPNPPLKAQTKSKLRPRKSAMSLTPTALDRLRQLLAQPDPKLIRVGVRNRGCSGLAYHLEYVDKPGMFDEMVEQDGVKVLVDSKALFSIIGSEMDWVEDKLSSRFVFRNPNIKEQCGCGESFMV
ncbi:MAG: hypothetical protein M1823_003720 [Watsoniomyces obsoletus]|nr:MAG: hypothetical protein M1823_003720 [Watsoniomyces obsoletus]